MSDPLRRGAVVCCDGRWAVVWTLCGHELVLLPIEPVRELRANDVPLAFADLLACGVALRGAAVQPRPERVVAAGWHVTGTMPGATMCRVVHGLVREVADERLRAKWADEQRGRSHMADERCVNLVG